MVNSRSTAVTPSATARKSLTCPPCKACGQKPRRHKLRGSRGLCRHCYYNLDVRARFAMLKNTHAVPDTDYADRPPPAPTAIPPGKDKVAVLVARAEAGLGLWHPADAPLQPDQPRAWRQGATQSAAVPVVHTVHLPRRKGPPSD